MADDYWLHAVVVQTLVLLKATLDSQAQNISCFKRKFKYRFLSYRPLCHRPCWRLQSKKLPKTSLHGCFLITDLMFKNNTSLFFQDGRHGFFILELSVIGNSFEQQRKINNFVYSSNWLHTFQAI